MNAMRQPVCGCLTNPLEFLRPEDMNEVPLGVTIASLAPTAKGLLICRVNGEWLSRESWESDTRIADVIEFIDVPQDRDALRGILQVAVAIAGAFVGGFPGFLIAFAGTTALNILLPPLGPELQRRPEQTGDALSTSLSGNQARLDQPIWKTCGRREISPPFASQPYFEYRPRVGAEDVNLDNDQYFYALYAVGIGNYDVIAKIGNTPITRFADVIRADYLAPGVQPTDVLANVTTASEVTSQVLESGRYVGGFAACAAQRTCAYIGIDVAATRGLGKDGALTVSWRVEYRPINDFGQVLGAWVVLATESRTAFTATPQRWSNKYTIATPARLEIRVVRTDVQDTDPAALHEIAWIGLRAYLAEPAPLNEFTAHFEVVMRASSQLSNQSSRDVRLLTKSYCRTWTPTGGWGSEVHTRNGALWMLDLLSSNTWGLKKADERIDLQSFYELSLTADDRQDRFDWTFDSSSSGWDALQLIARSCRARVFRRNGVISVARDELVDVPVTAFTPRNCMPGMSISEKLRTRSSPDAIVIEYQDHRTWEWLEVEEMLPGVTVPENPLRKRIEGIVGATHARREARYEAYNALYRPRVATWVTEMQGILPAYMSPVDFLADVNGYGNSGDVTNWSPLSFTLELSEPPDFSAGSLFLTLIRDDGTCTDPVLVTPGPTANKVVLPAAPDFPLILNSGYRERPKYLIGAKDLVKVVSIEDGGLTQDGAQLYRLTGLIDDDRVHNADLDLLPGPGEIQDPVGDPDDSDETSGGGTFVVINIVDASVYDTTDSTVDTADLVAGVTFGIDGVLHYLVDVTVSDAASQWSQLGLLEPAVAALYEIRATMVLSVDGDSTVTFDGTVDTWLSLDTARTWKITTGYTSPSSTRTAIRIVLFEIREIASGIVQDSGTIDLRTFIDAPTGG